LEYVFVELYSSFGLYYFKNLLYSLAGLLSPVHSKQEYFFSLIFAIPPHSLFS